VIPVPDAASVAAQHWLHRNGVDAGPSTGACLWGSHHLVSAMRQEGPVVTVIGDSGEQYRDTYLNPDWLSAKGLDPGQYEDVVGSW
jgi:cysteine synthase